MVNFVLKDMIHLVMSRYFLLLMVRPKLQQISMTFQQNIYMNMEWTFDFYVQDHIIFEKFFLLSSLLHESAIIKKGGIKQTSFRLSNVASGIWSINEWIKQEHML